MLQCKTILWTDSLTFFFYVPWKKNNSVWVWNDLRIGKYMQTVHFWTNCPCKYRMIHSLFLFPLQRPHLWLSPLRHKASLWVQRSASPVWHLVPLLQRFSGAMATSFCPTTIGSQPAPPPFSHYTSTHII